MHLGLTREFAGNVVIASGTKFKALPFNGVSGGVLAFACRSLTIESGAEINVDFAGFRGGREKFGHVYYSATNRVRNRQANNGEGPGKGLGGFGAKPCCHGSGGGGGSFGSRGGLGTPDSSRDGGDRRAQGGPTVAWKGRFYTPQEAMGSGGGAGGAGHPDVYVGLVFRSRFRRG